MLAEGVTEGHTFYKRYCAAHSAHRRLVSSMKHWRRVVLLQEKDKQELNRNSLVWQNFKPVVGNILGGRNSLVSVHCPDPAVRSLFACYIPSGSQQVGTMPVPLGCLHPPPPRTWIKSPTLVLSTASSLLRGLSTEASKFQCWSCRHNPTETALKPQLSLLHRETAAEAAELGNKPSIA